MNFKEYLPLAARTVKPLNSDIENVGHAVLGFFTEIQELEEALVSGDGVNVNEEIGDMFWYIALLANTAQVNFDHFTGPRVEEARTAISDLVTVHSYGLSHAMVCLVSSCLDPIKKRYIYNSDKVDKDKVDIKIFDILSILLAVCEFLGSDAGDIMKRNIEKLKKRYPEKYTDVDAVNRNLEEERKTLEGN